MGDRGGGREPKGGSLRKSSKNPGCAVAKAKREKKEDVNVALTSLACPRPCEGSYVDCGAAMLSRQFERDRDRVLSRARNDGVCAVVCWCPSIDKLPELTDLAADVSHAGHVYFVAGVHPDNVDRTNQKSHEDWLKKVEIAARKPECCAVMSGLNLSREHGTHFAQEALLKGSCEVAGRTHLPLILHIAPDTGDVNSLDRALEILKEMGLTGQDPSDERPETHVILHDALSATACNALRMSAVVEAGLLCAISAAGVTDEDGSIRTHAQELLSRIPLQNLLICSDAPWHTPQNHPDSYVKSQKNEPSNVPFVVDALYAIHPDRLSLARQAFADALKERSLVVLGLSTEEPVEEEAGAKAGGAREAASAREAAGARVTCRPPATKGRQESENAPPPGGGGACGADEGGSSGSRVDYEERGSQAASAMHSLDEEEEEVRNPGSKTTEEAERVHPLLTPPTRPEPHQPLYACKSCRGLLFSAGLVTKHGMKAKSVVFKDKRGGAKKGGGGQGADEAAGGLCSEFVFVTCVSEVGKFGVMEAFCGCGASIDGPVAKLHAAKMDLTDSSRDLEELAARAIAEAATALEQEEMGEKKKKEKREKKMVVPKGNNRGDYSEFRNKDIRVRRRTLLTDVEAKGAEGGVGGGEGWLRDDESDESDDTS